jgi:hypothetical protein
MTDEATIIWNRACWSDAESLTRQGDRALSALLTLHGWIMNGGVYHGVKEVQADRVQAGIDGYRFFGFDKAASFLEKARLMDDEELGSMERRVDREYAKLTGSDSGIGARFRQHFEKHRDLYDDATVPAPRREPRAVSLPRPMGGVNGATTDDERRRVREEIIRRRSLGR